MLTKKIDFKNFIINKKSLRVKKNFISLINSNNEILKSLSKNYKNSFKKKISTKFKKKSNFKDKRKSFGIGRSEKQSRETEKKNYSFKGKKKFFKKKQTKPSGFTNNPKFLEKKNLENPSSDKERKKFNFKGKKKFKSRNSRPKKFTFKKNFLFFFVVKQFINSKIDAIILISILMRFKSITTTLHCNIANKP